MRPLLLPKIILAATLSAGCAGTLGYSATVSSDGYGPDLVYAAPGVQVIADYDEPIFYADNFYWRFDSGTWYRSTNYRSGWGHAQPPPAVVRIERPQTFVHYRPQGWSPRRVPAAPRDHREPNVKAMRVPPPRVPPPARTAPPPRQQAPNSPGHQGDHGDQRGGHDQRDHRK